MYKPCGNRCRRGGGEEIEGEKQLYHEVLLKHPLPSQRQS